METTLVAPFAGTVVATPARTAEAVGAGMPVVVIEAMKMEHEIVAEQDAIVAQLAVAVSESVTEGQVLAVLALGAAPLAAGADRANPSRRARRRRRGNRRPTRGRHVVRLHRPRRHAGDAQPPQEGPAV